MAQETPFILEGNQLIREGESRSYALNWTQFNYETLTTGGVEAYVNGSTDSAALLSGSSGITGNVQTLPIITIPVGYGGLTIVVEPSMVSGGLLYKTGIILHVLKPGAVA
jgi:hypothetical protein